MMAFLFVKKKYVAEILDRFKMTACNSTITPMDKETKLMKNPGGQEVNNIMFKQIIGSLMYVTATRPDIMHSVSLVSRFLENPQEQHLIAAKKILRYLKGTQDFGIFYRKGVQGQLTGYVDSDFAGDPDDRKSTTGYIFMFGTGAIAWSSKKQPIVTLSSTEAEYVAATSGACQAVWLQRILAHMKAEQKEATILYCDNSSAIKLSKNPVFHGRSKHIHVRFHFLRELVEKGDIKLQHCKTEEQSADIFTKPLKTAAFMYLRSKIGIMSESVLQDKDGV